MKWATATAIALLATGSQAGEIVQDCANCPELVRIPAGRFLMGSTVGETERHAVPEEHAVVEWPRHEVVVERGFLMGRHEVTRAQYAVFAKASAWDER